MEKYVLLIDFNGYSMCDSHLPAETRLASLMTDWEVTEFLIAMVVWVLNQGLSKFAVFFFHGFIKYGWGSPRPKKYRHKGANFFDKGI